MIFTLKTDPVRTDHWWLFYIEPHDLSDNEQVLLHIENGDAHGECFDSLNHAIDITAEERDAVAAAIEALRKMPCLFALAMREPDLECADQLASDDFCVRCEALARLDSL